jgi:hypothetical protein
VLSLEASLGGCRPATAGGAVRTERSRLGFQRSLSLMAKTAHRSTVRSADVAQEVEQLTCNQQVVGSTPTIGSTRPFVGTARGEVPEWPKGADCKSAGVSLRRFESSPLHAAIVGRRGSSSVGRARAFQARGRGFDSRLPLVASCAHVAQSAEHFLGKEEVTGSNPVVGSPGHET